MRKSSRGGEAPAQPIAAPSGPSCLAYSLVEVPGRGFSLVTVCIGADGNILSRVDGEPVGRTQAKEQFRMAVARNLFTTKG